MTRRRAGIIASVVMLIVLGATFAVQPGRTEAARRPVPTGTDWQAHDTAVYVVSTLNLLRQRNGQPAAALFGRRGVTEYAVYADHTVPGLYFIQLSGRSGSLTLIYRLGWRQPKSMAPHVWGLRIRVALPADITAAQADPRDLLAIFTALP